MNVSTLGDRFNPSKASSTGFDYLRLFLASYVLAWHCVWASVGSLSFDGALWSGPFRFIFASILPMFFALSGFLVAGSLLRTKLYQFVVLRIIRIVPALAVEIFLCAILLGFFFTKLPLAEYLQDKRFYAYFLNIIGFVHYVLPGVFSDNVGGRAVNLQLWTIPYELQSYILLAVLSAACVVKKRHWYLGVVVALTLIMQTLAFRFNPPRSFTGVPGPMLVLCFLTAVSLFLYRDRIPCSGYWAIGAAVLAAIFLQMPATCYLAAWPVAYVTVWLGLLRLPKIEFGDLSYGVFLFHFPIEQSIMALHPEITHWWILLLMALPLTFGMAWLSWNLVEHPILSRKKQILGLADRLFARLQQAATAART